MNVELLSYTPDALSLLLKTKNTRLKHDEDPAQWSAEKRAEHLAYMKDTIRSSWEFVDYVFQFSGVTRAFTHQLVRTRTGSYAQESQRTIDASANGVLSPEFTDVQGTWWDEAIGTTMRNYKALLELGAAPQDARGLLPTNILTSIIAKFNLRTLHEMARVRLCTRTQGEYQSAFRAMRAAVIAVHPWVEEHRFLEPQCVAEGTCAFPRYGRKDCPVWFPELDREAARSTAAERFWSAKRFSASPRAAGGKSQ